MLFIAVTMILTVAILLLTGKSLNRTVLENSENIQKQLVMARDGIVGFARGNTTLPGKLLYPDRGDDAAGFDGEGDCVPTGTAVVPAHLIGRYPFVGEGGCAPYSLGINIGDSRDPANNSQPLHYAISGNLVERRQAGGVQNNGIHSRVVEEANGWLSVFNAQGQLLSNQVAFIVFHPGEALPGQNRGVGADATEYLDSFLVPVIGLVSNADPTDARFVSAPMSDSFNDRLIFVTANQLMGPIEARILRESQTLLQDFFDNNGNRYPANWNHMINFVNTDAGYVNSQYLNLWFQATNGYIAYNRPFQYFPKTDCNPSVGTGCGAGPEHTINATNYHVAIQSTVAGLNNNEVGIQ